MIDEKEYALIVGANLRRIANNAGKTQADVSRDLGILKSTVSTWFRGERCPRMNKIDLLCNYFNVKRSDLMEPYTDEPKELELTASETRIIEAYRAADPITRNIIRDILHITGGTS